MYREMMKTMTLTAAALALVSIPNMAKGQNYDGQVKAMQPQLPADKNQPITIAVANNEVCVSQITHWIGNDPQWNAVVIGRHLRRLGYTHVTVVKTTKPQSGNGVIAIDGCADD